MSDQFETTQLEPIDGKPTPVEPKKKKRGLIALLTLLVVAVVGIGGGSYAYARSYDGKALPGTQFLGQDVSGKNAAEIAQLVKKQADATKVTVNLGGESHEASLADLGISVDAKTTAEKVVSPDPSVLQVISSSFQNSDSQVKPSLIVDKEAIKNWVNNLIPAESKQAHDAQVVWNNDSLKWDVTPAQASRGVDVDEVSEKIAAKATELKSFSVEQGITEVQPKITTEMASKGAEEANSMIATKISLAGADKTFTLAGEQRGNWIYFEPGKNTPGLQAQVSKQAITESVQAIAKKLEVKPIDGKQQIDENGKLFKVVTEKKDGQTVENLKEITDQVINAVQNKTEFNGQFKLKKVEAKVEQEKINLKEIEAQKKKQEEERKKQEAEKAQREKEAAEARARGVQIPAGVKPGANWVDINLANKTLTVYNGYTPVFGPRKIVDGKQGYETPVGTYKIYHRLPKQDMTNASKVLKSDPRYYYSKDVPWVSYFIGGYAIHGAYWRNSFGYSGSHGCINMSVSDAQWVYNNTNYGTVVHTHY